MNQKLLDHGERLRAWVHTKMRPIGILRPEDWYWRLGIITALAIFVGAMAMPAEAQPVCDLDAPHPGPPPIQHPVVCPIMTWQGQDKCIISTENVSATQVNYHFYCPDSGAHWRTSVLADGWSAGEQDYECPVAVFSEQGRHRIMGPPPSVGEWRFVYRIAKQAKGQCELQGIPWSECNITDIQAAWHAAPTPAAAAYQWMLGRGNESETFYVIQAPGYGNSCDSETNAYCWNGRDSITYGPEKWSARSLRQDRFEVWRHDCPHTKEGCTKKGHGKVKTHCIRQESDDTFTSGTSWSTMPCEAAMSFPENPGPGEPVAHVNEPAVDRTPFRYGDNSTVPQGNKATWAPLQQHFFTDEWFQMTIGENGAEFNASAQMFCEYRAEY